MSHWNQAPMALHLPQYGALSKPGRHRPDHLCHEPASPRRRPGSVHGGGSGHRPHLWSTRTSLQRGDGRPGLPSWRVLPGDVVLGFVTRWFDLLDDRQSYHGFSFLPGLLRAVVQPVYPQLWAYSGDIVCRGTGNGDWRRLFQPSGAQGVLVVYLG